MKLNGQYECAIAQGGELLSIYIAGENISFAVFEFGDTGNGQAAFEAVKTQIAKDGGTLLNLNTGEYLVATVEMFPIVGD